jgi:hypothetical protein
MASINRSISYFAEKRGALPDSAFPASFPGTEKVLKLPGPRGRL